MTKSRLIAVAALFLLGVYAYNRQGASQKADFDRLVQKELAEKSAPQTRFSAPKSSKPKPLSQEPVTQEPVTQGSATKTAGGTTSTEVFEPAVAESEDEVILDEARQKEIWDLEHFTFELEWKFGKLVKQALQRRNRPSLAERFLPGATGSVPSGPPERSDDRTIADGGTKPRVW